MTDADTPPLETGWLATTPVEDSYLRRFLWNWAEANAAAVSAFGGHVRNTPAVRMADAGRPVVFANCATLTQPLTAATVGATLAQIGAFYDFDDPARLGEVLLISAWPTGDLRPFGWTLMGHPPLQLLPPGVPARPSPAGLTVQRVTTLEQLHAWERTVIHGYPLEGLEEAPAGALISPSLLADPRYGAWVGYAGGVPVAASAAWVEFGVVNVTLVATLPDERRKGYGEALTWAASRLDPTLPAMLVSSDDGRPVYERMGYLPLNRMTFWYRGRP
ncbi:MAG: GNAT family N-acetyltransferase [Thermomicrobiales bacterium]